MQFRIAIGIALISVLPSPSAWASTTTLGQNGINSTGLTLFNGMPLDGDGVRIGQVEDIRPALPGFDSPAIANSFVVPAGLFIQAGGSISPNANLAPNHATHVASVLISTDATDSNMNGEAPLGVVPMADLYAAAYVTQGASLAAYRDFVLTAQYIGNSTGSHIINFSSSKAQLNVSDPNDGNSQMTLGLDWIASRYDVLNVVFGYQGSGRPYPTDHFNGMTVGRSARIASVYRQVSAGND